MLEEQWTPVFDLPNEGWFPPVMLARTTELELARLIGRQCWGINGDGSASIVTVRCNAPGLLSYVL